MEFVRNKLWNFVLWKVFYSIVEKKQIRPFRKTYLIINSKAYLTVLARRDANHIKGTLVRRENFSFEYCCYAVKRRVKGHALLFKSTLYVSNWTTKSKAQLVEYETNDGLKVIFYYVFVWTNREGRNSVLVIKHHPVDAHPNNLIR